jgi:predicted dehydrogenase
MDTPVRTRADDTLFSMKSSQRKRIRYAVVGLGHISQVAVLPAFSHAANSELAALISGDPVKAKKLSKQYGAPSFHYDDFEQAVEEQKLDAVYIALPNSQHRAFTERAAKLGVHVLCEKPMADSEKNGRAMIEACKKAGVRLMIAYRLHFAPAHVEAITLAQSGKLGDLRYFSSIFGMQVKADNIRTDAEDAGGPLRDLGVYCINAARYLFAQEPEEVLAVTTSKNGDARFKEVEEMATAILRFPGQRIAQFTCSFGSGDVASLELVGTQGMLRIEPAYEYVGSLKWSLSIKGKQKERTFPPGDQFAPELIHFSDCILNRKTPEPDGYDGLADVRIIDAIFQSAKLRRAVRIRPVTPQRRITPAQAIQRRPVRKPDVTRAEAPHSE